jgi:hypothetical protein
MGKLTKKHRATIRNICPLNPLLPELTFRGQDYVDAVVAALNAIASEPEAVTVAREAMLTQLAKHPLEGGVSKVDLNAIAKFRRAIVASRREALRAKRARK